MRYGDEKSPLRGFTVEDISLKMDILAFITKLNYKTYGNFNDKTSTYKRRSDQGDYDQSG